MTYKVVVCKREECFWIIFKNTPKALSYKPETFMSSLDKSRFHFKGAEVVILCKISTTFMKKIHKIP